LFDFSFALADVLFQGGGMDRFAQGRFDWRRSSGPLAV
jgi:hypothetical protein